MDIRKKQRAVVEALEDIKGRDVVVYDVSRQPSIFERVIIASGDSTRQVAALANSVREKLKSLGATVYGVEGERSSEWVLVDLGDVVVHVMHPTVRAYYNLEEIWGVKPVRLRNPALAGAAATKRAPAATAARKRAPRKAAKKRAKKSRA